MKNRKQPFLLLLLAGALTAAGCRESEKLSYETDTAVRTSLTNSVTATGTVEPISQVEVGTQVSGIISKLYVDYNSVVTENQLIAELDRSVLETELEASQANLDGAKVEYEYQAANYERIKGLYEKELVSRSEYDDARYQYERAKYTYMQAKANIQKAERNLSYTRITSPIDGVVLSREVDEGQTVAASYSTPNLFIIANDLRKMQVIADVDEADIGEVKEGQSVDFTVDAFPDDLFRGSVTQVRLQATTTSNVVTYEVVIDAPNPDLKLMPGLTANVTIYTLRKDGILTVPVRALRFTPAGEERPGYEKCVWIKEADGTFTPREVETGDSDGIRTEILSGLREGETIVTGTRLSLAGNRTDGENGNPFMPKPPAHGENKRTR